jgi:hypothetical protein
MDVKTGVTITITRAFTEIGVTYYRVEDYPSPVGRERRLRVCRRETPRCRRRV